MSLFFLAALVAVLILGREPTGTPIGTPEAAADSPSAPTKVMAAGYVAVGWEAHYDLIDSLQPFNQSSDANPLAREIAQNTREFPGVECFAGFNADFPVFGLVTLIWRSGAWLQFTPDVSQPQGYEESLVLRGDDYREAGLSPRVLNRLLLDGTTYVCDAYEGRITIIADAG